MSKRRQRFLPDLYNVTHTLTEPKITPILQGNFRMQGPTIESDHDIHTNMMPFQVEKEHISSKTSKSHCRPESGACNVCSAPCSSCLHINQSLMGSKVDEYSGETSSENAFSYSVNDVLPSNKIVHSETEQKSWSRNFVSGSSSNTSENVDCETSFRNSDLSATSEIVSVSPKADDFKDHQSCVTEIPDSKLCGFGLSNEGNTDLSSFPVSANTPTAQENLMAAFLQPSPECLDVRSNFNESQNSSKRPRIKRREILQADLSSQNSGLLETPVDTAGDAIDRLNLEGDVLDKSPSSALSPEVLGENLFPRLHGELLKYPSGHVNSLAVDTSAVNIHSDLAEDDLGFVEKNEGNDNPVMCLPNAKETSSEAHPKDECDDSDLVEHDVKVCDICGDAGREDLLAICCRCSDGAEHTYCMREMVDKVPLGDWLCEECKFEIEMKSQNQEIVVMVDGGEKINSSEPTKPESLKTYKKCEAVDENRIHNDCPAKVLAKRLLDDVEVSCPAKRRALEQDNGPAKMSTLPVISRNSSFKLDRLKAKSNQHSSSNSLAAPESGNFPASASQLRNQGTFIKSNSFNSLNMKPKVNLLDDVLRQRQRSGRESASLNRKEGVSRSMSKSVSFKLPTTGRLNLGESKVKMSSPKFSHVQDTKGSKHTKDHNISERKNSFQLERLPMANTGILGAKNDQKLVSSSETSTLYSSRKSRDAKAVSSDSRSMLLSKSLSFATRRGSEQSIPQGEVKRQSSTSLFGVSSANGDCGHVLKPNQGGLKVDSSSSYCFAERPSSNSNEGHLDILSQEKESTNIGERAKDSASGRSKESSMIGNRMPCQKCKEIGHSAQSCTTDSPGSPAKHLKVGVDGKDKLKAAIEAAVLRKPGIYRKHRLSDQCNDVSPSNVNYEITSQVPVSDSSNRGNVATSAEMKEEQMVMGSPNTDFCEQETVDDDVKQFPITLFEASSSITAEPESYPFVPFEGLSLPANVPSHVSDCTPTFFKRLAIPENKYIWKGGFEVHRIGSIIDFFDGIQAHLSVCASPKVLEAMNKLNNKVLLNELPRLTTWPVQFQENGVREDNIAIFFFAKDCASYEKSYKGLLHNMMKNDAALKGSFDGFELMIFPSNQLPEKFQRWNSLFFLWGVFRGKRTNKRHVLGSDEQIFVPQSIPSTITSFPVNNSSVLLVDGGVSAGSIGPLASETNAPKLTTSEALKEGYDGRVSSNTMNDDRMQAEHLIDSTLSLRSVSVEQSNVAKSFGETAGTSILCDELKHASTSLEGGVGADDKREPESNVCVESAFIVCGFKERQQMPVNCNAYLSRQHSSSFTTAREVGSVGNIGEGNLLDKMSGGEYEASQEDRLAHDSPSRTGNQMVIDRCTKVVSDGTSQVKPGIAIEDIVVEEASTREKEKTDCCGHHGANGLNSSSSKGSSSQIRGVAPGSPLTNGDGGALDGNDISAERYFFPVDPLPEQDVGMVRKLMTSQMMSALTEDQFHDASPNLELALGAETKTSLQGTPTFLVGKEDQKVISKLCPPEAAATGEEDDVSGSLSLSLSFPFPDREEAPKSLSKSEQLMPETGHVNTSLLLFGLEGQVGNRRPTLHSGHNSASQGRDRFL